MLVSIVLQRRIIGWLQGRMELGARALGSRSILSDPSDKEMKDRLNRYVKFREDFRPFAPSVLFGNTAILISNNNDFGTINLVYGQPDQMNSNVTNSLNIQNIPDHVRFLYSLQYEVR